MTDPRPISFYFDGQLRASVIFPAWKFSYRFTDDTKLDHRGEPFVSNDTKAIAIPLNWRSRLLDDGDLDGIRKDPEFDQVFFIDEQRGWIIIPPKLFVLLCQRLFQISSAAVAAGLNAPAPKKPSRYMKMKKSQPRNP